KGALAGHERHAQPVRLLDALGDLQLRGGDVVLEGESRQADRPHQQLAQIVWLAHGQRRLRRRHLLDGAGVTVWPLWPRQAALVDGSRAVGGGSRVDGGTADDGQVGLGRAAVVGQRRQGNGRVLHVAGAGQPARGVGYLVVAERGGVDADDAVVAGRG